MPASSPRRACANRSSSHASAVRFVKYPAPGRPRPVQAGPIFFCTWRPSGSRYFAYQTGPRCRSTRKTWPEIGSASTVVPTYISWDIFGTRCYKLAPAPRAEIARILNGGAAKESNLPTVGLQRPAGFEDRMGHQTPAAPQQNLDPAEQRSAHQDQRQIE